jgi:hypothetical protein
MNNHLIPPFVMREAGIKVHDTPKIHMDDPGISDHSIEFPETNFRIPLSLHGIFSYLPTDKPSPQMLEDCEEVYVLTPSRWNPHDSAYAHNEAHMLDWQGEMVQPKDRQTILLSEVEEDAEISAACYIGHVESQAVIQLLDKHGELDMDESCQNNPCPKAADEIASLLTSVNPTLTDECFHQSLKIRNKLSQFQMDIGSTNTSKDKYIISDDETTSDNVSSDESCINEDVLLNTIFKKSNEGIFNDDNIMVSAVHAGRHQGVKAKDLAKLWCIDEYYQAFS